MLGGLQVCVCVTVDEVDVLLQKQTRKQMYVPAAGYNPSSEVTEVMSGRRCMAPAWLAM